MSFDRLLAIGSAIPSVGRPVLRPDIWSNPSLVLDSKDWSDLLRTSEQLMATRLTQVPLFLEYVWILSRDGTLSNPSRQNIYENLDRLKINRVGLQLSERSACAGRNTTLSQNQRESDEDLVNGTSLKPVPTPAAIPSSPSPSINIS